MIASLEWSWIEGIYASARARALPACQFLILTKDTCLAIISRHPKLGLNHDRSRVNVLRRKTDSCLIL
jgi:hypothetical protein